MLYSGADLIRTSGQQFERLERLKAADEVQPIQPAQNPKSKLDDQTQGALLRFARFIHKEGEKKKAPPKPSRNETKSLLANPYSTAETRTENLFGRGQMLDVYV
jgi:hypothetical protein